MVSLFILKKICSDFDIGHHPSGQPYLAKKLSAVPPAGTYKYRGYFFYKNGKLFLQKGINCFLRTVNGIHPCIF
jgi:hypothetical protein